MKIKYCNGVIKQKLKESKRKVKTSLREVGGNLIVVKAM